MNFNPVILSIPLFFILIGIELLIERFSSNKYYRINDALTNINCGVIQQITGIFFKVLSVGFYQYVFENFALLELNQTWWYWILLFIGVDFLYYWAHRVSHEVNLFWGGHVVHHQSEDYNLSVAIRQSTFQVVWTFFFYIPLAILGFNTIDFVFIMGLNLIYQFWIHTETIGKMGWFEIVFNTPSHHRVHHGRNPKYIDRNHAGVFIIWDKMFGTFQKEEERPTYGITKPLNSWNPLWANIEPYVNIWKHLILIKGIGNKIKYLFKKPGWLPQEMGGYQSAPELDNASYVKYSTTTTLTLNWYVLFQFTLALTGTAYFLFKQDDYTLYEKGLISSIIIITITNGGLLFEENKRAKPLELSRIIVLSLIGLYLSYLFDCNLILLISSPLFAVISIPWLYSANFNNS
ncbi:MAG: sterol desaturase family protein [Cyclobacteriaceae bacterium]|nr:sterol desaturase family protein [Cyclobacteriaceae bacterium]